MGQLSPGTHERLVTMLQQPSPDLISPQSMSSSAGGDVGEMPNDLDGVYDIMDYADRFFNDHERDTGGTLMKSLKKRKQSASSVSLFCVFKSSSVSLFCVFKSSSVSLFCVFKSSSVSLFCVFKHVPLLGDHRP